ncbi:HNH endonuclease [Bernardetia sp. ABR2-2B]|uniref:HNH endonuclease n=1 Tax=Bernardetia sp. ABR2-2B TaxID=3127472 RepID=UPI0030CBE5E5
MRKVNKPSEVPAVLQRRQAELKEQLVIKQPKFWKNKHYAQPTKKDLKEIYKNKCGFCERVLKEDQSYEGFTVEHFRPKSHYYWLALEWTNLFPLCRKCNKIKDDSFPTKNQSVQHPPINENGNIILSKCLADSEELLNEKPFYLHPEIDEPLDFFEVDKSGQFVAKSDLNGFDSQRANEMIDKFLGNQNLVNERKKPIQRIKNQLDSVVINFKEYCSENYTDREIKLAFFSLFKTLFTLGDKEQEFSLVGYYMNENFEDFFLEEYEFGEQELIKYAYSLFLEENAP